MWKPDSKRIYATACLLVIIPKASKNSVLTDREMQMCSHNVS